MELYKHQLDFLNEAPNKRLLCWDTGTGKTLTAIEWAQFKAKGSQGIVICPKALKENWNRNIPLMSKGNIHVLTKEEFKKVHKTLPNVAFVVVDEAHHFAGMKSALSKNLYWYLKKHNIENILFLTATPYRSSPWDIFVLARHLGYDWNYMDFKAKFFTEAYIYGRYIPKIRSGIEEDIAKLVGIFSNVVKLEDCVDVPEQTFETEYFALTKEQEKGKESITDVNPIVRYTKYHEIENGFVISDGYEETQEYECLKNDRLLELAETTDKIAIVARYNLQLDHLARVLGHLKRPIFMIRGDVKDRDAVVQKVEKSKKCIVLIQAACSEGYELPSIGLMIFASLDFSYVNYKQMCGRILRINKLKKNVYLHLVSSGIDAEVHKSVMKKQDFSLEIYAKRNTG